MPLLAALFMAIASGFLSFFTKIFAKKWLVGLTFAGIFTAMTGALYVALSLALNGVYYSLPSWPGMQLAMYVAAPGNLPTAVSTLISAEATIALYLWNVRLLKIMHVS